MFVAANYTEYSDYGTWTNHAMLCCAEDTVKHESSHYIASNITYRIILDNRTAVFEHPNVTNPFTSKLTHWQDDLLGAYLFIIGE